LYSILSLMTQINTGAVVLPDIQRSFVWSEEQICALFDSLFRGYPIGFFLFWKAVGSNKIGEPEELQVEGQTENNVDSRIILYHEFIRTYEDGQSTPKQNELKANEAKFFVLDGQQRLQSLYLGLEGTYNSRDLYIDLSCEAYSSQGEIKYFVRFFNIDQLKSYSTRNPKRMMVRLKDFARLPPDRIKTYKQTVLKNKFSLSADSSSYIKACEIIDDVRTALTWESRVPISFIDADALTTEECKSLDEVADIFVRVNDGGTKLSKMDLVFSLMKSRWTKASESIETLCNEINSKGEFFVTKDFVIRSLMVFLGNSSQYKVDQIRKSDLMAQFESIFPKANLAIKSTIDFLVQSKGGGIKTWRLLSGGQRADRGYNILIPIALFLYLRPTQEVPEKEYRRMRRYLYAAILSRYAVRYVENRLDKIAKVVFEAKKSEQNAFPVEECIALMKEAEKFSSFDELIGKDNTLDPLLNILVGGGIDFSTLLNRNSPQRDHIFPQSKLRENGFSEEKINHFANMQLLGAINNILKTNTNPMAAFESFEEKVLLGEDYLIPKNLLCYEKYEEFLQERTKLILNRVNNYLSDSQI